MSLIELPVGVGPISEVVAQPIEWLWLWRLALGKLAIFDGDPGLSKSLLALDLCAHLSRGLPFPDTDAPGEPACSIVFNAEDCVADTIRPRLQALGADLSRVFVVQRGDATDLLRIPSRPNVLEEALARSGARLVVIDPIMAFFDQSVQIGSDMSVRRALQPLVQLAEKYRCAILLLRHLNKYGRGRCIYRGGGSIGIAAACRSAWLIGQAPQVPGRCVLAQVKNNVAPPQPSLAYELVPQEGQPPKISWLGRSEWAADDLLVPGRTARPSSPRDCAREFLEDFLEAGPRTSRELWAAAQERGISERTLFRAKQELEIRCARSFEDGRPVCRWLLPGQQSPAVDELGDLEPWLEPLRKQFPPSTPLDED